MSAVESPDAPRNYWLDHEQRIIRLETLFETVATKADLAELRVEMERMRGEHSSEIEKARGDLSAAVEKVRGDLSTEIQKTRTWMFGVIFGFQAAGVAATVTILRLLGGP